MRKITFSWFCPSHGTGSNGQITLLSLDEVIHSAVLAEEMGFSSILTPADSNCFDPWMLSSFIISETQEIKPIIALRPGFIEPVYTARMITTLHQLSKGRVEFNIVTGGSPVELAKEGSLLNHDQRYERTYEYMEIIKNLMSNCGPYNYKGEYYNLKNATLFPEKYNNNNIKFYIAGASDYAKRIADKFGTVYLLWAEPINHIRQQLSYFDTFNSFGLRINIIVRKNRTEAVEIANKSFDRSQKSKRLLQLINKHSESIGQKKMSALALEADVHDSCLWTGNSIGKTGAVPTLVGSTNDVRESLERYIELGISHFILASDNHDSEMNFISEEILSFF